MEKLRMNIPALAEMAYEISGDSVIRNAINECRLHQLCDMSQGLKTKAVNDRHAYDGSTLTVDDQIDVIFTQVSHQALIRCLDLATYFIMVGEVTETEEMVVKEAFRTFLNARAKFQL